MDSLTFSFETVFPLFVPMAVGFLCRRFGIIDEVLGRRVNNIVFRVFLPLMLFKSIYQATVDQISDPWVYVYGAGAAILQFALLFWLVPLFEKDDSRRGVQIQAIGRSNYALFGTPIVAAMVADGNTAVAALMAVLIIPIFNGAAVIALEKYRAGKTGFKRMALGIIKNPLIIATLIGLVFMLTGVKLPEIVMRPISSMGAAATPVALFVLGGSLNFHKVKKNLRPLTIGVVGRLVISPLIFCGAAALLGFRGAEYAALFALFASPVSVSSYTMTQQIGGDDELAAEEVVFTAVFCIVTIFIFTLIGKELALF